MKTPVAIAIAKERSDCAPENIDTLVQLVQSVESIKGDIVECGSYKCGSTIAMAASTSKYIFGFDTFEGLPYSDGGFENFADVDFDEVLRAIHPYTNIVLFKGKHEETVGKFTPRPISMLFMDSDYYQSHLICLKHFVPMLTDGGKIVFHDYGFPSVRQAVKEVLGDVIVTPTDSPNMHVIDVQHASQSVV